MSIQDKLADIIKYSKKLKLLYVEDNTDARKSTIGTLKIFFDDIVVAVDGEDGFRKFRENKIDLIITDINMPKMNGLEMIQKIQEVDKEISTLVLSAYNESGYFMDSIKLSVEGYLLKPIEVEQFLDVLDKVIKKAKLKHDLAKNINFLEQYQEITNKSSIVSKTDSAGIITYVNDRFCKISEYSGDELIGQNHNLVRDPNTPPSFYKELWHTIKDKKEIWQGVIKNLSKNGHSYYVKSTIKPILDQDNNLLEYIASSTDITDVMNPAKQLQNLVDNVDEAIVAIVRIEEFANLEKFYGRRLVTTIEKKFALKLSELAPVHCGFERVFILGDGEYAFAKDKNNCALGMEDVIEQLKTFQQKVNEAELDLGEVDYDISVLLSLSYGENALENAKYGIKELVDINQNFMVANNLSRLEHDRAAENIKILKMVKKAIETSNIVSYFQPIINNSTMEIEKYESLVRLIDDDEKIVPPFLFLEVAKQGKYYSQITDIVLENSFNALKISDKNISMNLSALDIEKESTRVKIMQLLQEYRDDASRVVFELLEDENVKEFETIETFINDVKTFGVKIAIDDFGVGYSNLERLLNYQPDILKIDGSLIKNILTDKLSFNIVETIVAFAKKQHLQLVAEYVENEEIFKLLNHLGVDYSQGYYFGKPEALEL